MSDLKKVKCVGLLLSAIEKTTDYVETIQVNNLTNEEMRDIEFCSMIVIALIEKLEKGNHERDSN